MVQAGHRPALPGYHVTCCRGVSHRCRVPWPCLKKRWYFETVSAWPCLPGGNYGFRHCPHAHASVGMAPGKRDCAMGSSFVRVFMPPHSTGGRTTTGTLLARYHKDNPTLHVSCGGFPLDAPPTPQVACPSQSFLAIVFDIRIERDCRCPSQDGLGEGGANPPRTRRCNRGRTPQYAIRKEWGSASLA